MKNTLKNQTASNTTKIIIAIAVIAVGITVFFMLRTERDESIKIGAILSISGPASYVGEEIRDGMLLAINEINPRGGINGRKIELIIEDSETNAQKGKEAFKRIEASHHPILYTSALSAVSMALAPLAETNRVVLIGLSATATELTKQNEWIYRYFPTAKDEVPPILSILEDLKVKELGMIYSNDDYGKSFFELTKEKFEETGGIVRGEPFEGKTLDFKKPVARLKDAEAMYIVVYPGHLERVFKQLKEEQFKGVLVAAGNASVPSVRSLPEAGGVYVAAPIIYNPKYIFAWDTKERYEARYGKPFNHYAASGYDVIKLLAGLLEDEVISRKDIKSLLEYGFIYPGVFGHLEVKPGERDIHFPLHPAQIINGEVKYLR